MLPSATDNFYRDADFIFQQDLAHCPHCQKYQLVIAPAGRLVAVRGQPIILGCEFTPDSYPDLSSLVVTWQRKEDARVVHSFYYNQDQLDRQSEDYWNRTALFITELKKGNASLRIEEVGPKDVGQYLCMVSNTKGTDKAQVRLEYGAFYTEPRLSISFTCSNVMVWYEAEGFPKPEVSWSDDQGQNLSHNTELTERLNETMGLYYLKSSYVAQSPKLNVTFTLKNPLLNQHMQRPVNLTYGKHARHRVKFVILTLSFHNKPGGTDLRQRNH
uniref:Si:dkey-71p21.13 n=1 Tax=Astyanax mexicanus TaxID=7994 RepID=A0A8B9H494_ASTMX